MGKVQMGNGPVMEFSAPPDSQGAADVLTPEDAFVTAVNTCIMLMFIWACERFKVNFVSYTCRAEGTKLVELDRTEIFTQVILYPVIKASMGEETPESVERRVRKALGSAQKYSLVVNSIKSQIILQPEIEIIR
jgi:organic hydroperoxide reductase OsmC/OhrA